MKSRALRSLLWLSAANVLVACLLCVLHPHQSEFSILRSDLHLNLLRDDSSSFMGVACATAAKREPVYATLFFGQGFKYIYPPSAMFTCSAASALHVRLAALINVVALLSWALTLVLDGDLFLLLCPCASRRERYATLLVIVSLGVLFSPLLYAVYLGQMQVFLDLLFTLAVWLWVRGYRGSAGTSLALICVFKPPLAFFLLWGLLRREWKFTASFGAALAAIQAAAVWRFGWREELDYVRVLSFLSHHGEVLAGNQSFNGLLERWAGNGLNIVWTRTSPYPAYNRFVYIGTVFAWVALLGFGLAWPMLRGWRNRASDFLMFGLLATIASPIAWTHHYGLFYVACIYFAAIRLGQGLRLPVLFCASFLVLANTWNVLDRFVGTRWNPLLSYELYAGIGIIFCLILILNLPYRVGDKRNGIGDGRIP